MEKKNKRSEKSKCLDGHFLKSLMIIIPLILLMSVFSISFAAASAAGDCDLWCKIIYLFTGNMPATGQVVAGIQDALPDCGVLSCGSTITTSCMMTSNMSCPTSANAITIGASGITLDCNGHSITGVGSSGYNGIDLSSMSNVVIQNCVVSGFYSGSGIRLGGASSGNNLIKNSNISGQIFIAGANYYQYNQIAGSNIGTLSFSGTVKYNTVTNSVINSIVFASGGPPTQYNSFYNNKIGSASTLGLLNYWNNSLGGNYWTSYSPGCANVNPPIGICDNAYDLNPIYPGMNVDYLPLASLPVWGCGDGTPDPGEECDDGNNIDDCICLSDCNLPYCGDNLVCAPEECDDGNNNNNDGCSASCIIEKCGDNVINLPGEQCDGTNLNGQNCTSLLAPGWQGLPTCLANCSGFDTSGCGYCGNNEREGNEVCDGTDLGGVTCEIALAAPGWRGELDCEPKCQSFNTSECLGPAEKTANGTFTESGIYLVSANATDLGGNSAGASQLFYISIDLNDPVISDDYGARNGTWVEPNQTVNFIASDIGSGIDKVYYCEGTGCDPQDPQAGMTLIPPYHVDYTSPINTIARYQATDLACRNSTIGEYTVMIKMPCDDNDGDEWGVCPNCNVTSGCMHDGNDCNDNDALINPGASDANCNGIDENCDGTPDDGYVAPITECGIAECEAEPWKINCTDGTINLCYNLGTLSCVNGQLNDTCIANPKVIVYQDFDMDKYGSQIVMQNVCTIPNGYIRTDDDCVDTDNMTNPAAVDICDVNHNVINKNCNVSDDYLLDCNNFCGDADVDGYVISFDDLPWFNQIVCPWIVDDGDCNDGDAAINPVATEICDGADNNCNGITDEGCPSTTKFDALTILQGLSSYDKKSMDELGKGIKEIKKSLGNLNPDGDKHIIWIDSIHIACKHGYKVFDHEKKSVGHLQKVTDPAILSQVNQAINAIVQADRMLALTAINEAPAGKYKDKAIENFNKGEAATDLKHKIHYYRKAWKYVNKHCDKTAPKASCIDEITVMSPMGDYVTAIDDEVGHPETVFTDIYDNQVAIHTSCSRCLYVGQVISGWTITELVDDGSLALKCAKK